MPENQLKVRRSLIKSKLGVLDKSGSRIFQYPLEVKGPYRDWRNRVYAFFIVLFLVLPWIKIGGVQSILLDIPGRKFNILGIRFWAHDAPMLFFVFGGVALVLIFVTAIWGRVWCGWACPQTVFIDGVFRKIEFWIEGRANLRKKLDQQDWNFEKIRKRGLKYIVYFIVTMIITHSFLAYFVGSDKVLGMMTSPPAENWASFLFVVISTSILYFNFTWFREQFCIIICPYGRLQSSLFDTNTMIVGYDKERGDCIECKKCVWACPTGIDIRDGVQLECIGCTACMDACDEIMEKVNKPKGLIKYTSEEELSGNKRNVINIRTVTYACFLVLMASSFTYLLATRKPFGVELIRTELLPKSDTSQNSIFRYSVELANQSFVPKKFMLEVSGEGDYEFVTQTNPVTVPPGNIQRADFFLKMGGGSLNLPDLKLRVKPEGGTDFQELSLKR